MVDQRVARRLSAILAADIAGYSALMSADEARTVRDLKGHQAVVLPMIGDFAGRARRLRQYFECSRMRGRHSTKDGRAQCHG
jgi:class 3 adenylate cyclase